jgi:hypothetical protein
MADIQEFRYSSNWLLIISLAWVTSWLALVLVVSETLAESREREREREDERLLVSIRVMFS